MYTFKPDYVFTKGIVYGEFFDPSTNNLLGFSEYITDFALNGSVNAGDVEGGPGNMLIMSIPDTARLAITAKTADASLNNMGLPIGADVGTYGVIETVTAVTESSGSLTLSGAVAPLGGDKVVCYILTSTGSDKASVEANSGAAYIVNNGAIEGFEPVTNATYCVKYFVSNSSAAQLTIPALFAPKVVRAHFAVNCYAKNSGSDVMSSSLYKIRHYYFPRYMFTAGLQDSVGQTTTGTVDLSGSCLTFEEAITAGACTSSGSQIYGFIVDELIGTNTSTAAVQGIYFIGLGAGVTIAPADELALPVKYVVNNVMTEISDMSQVTFTSSATDYAIFEDEHENVIKGVADGASVATVSVTNSVTGVTYTDAIDVTVATPGD